MYLFSMELGIRLSFVKTSEFRGGVVKPPNPPRYATGPNRFNSEKSVFGTA
jgi:hypothetical protein